jgi:hypothetical protein
MLIKIHKSYRYVVAVCDSDLIGRKFQEGNKIIDVRESFYTGEEKSEQEILADMKFLAREDATFNIVGEKSVSLALKAGLITKEGIKKVQGIPFALILL